MSHIPVRCVKLLRIEQRVVDDRQKPYSETSKTHCNLTLTLFLSSSERPLLDTERARARQQIVILQHPDFFQGVDVPEVSCVLNSPLRRRHH
jgi:hypothetical protein